ncbi:MAG: AraC family transcriptional regulator [Pseudomonadota bacterium]
MSHLTGYAVMQDITSDLSGGPANFDVFSSEDWEETRYFASRLFCPHDFKLDARERRLAAKIASANIAGLGFSSVQYGARTTVDPGRLKDFYLAQITTAGRIDVRCGQQRDWATAQNATFLSPTEPSHMQWRNGATILSVQIPRLALERQLEELMDKPLAEPVVFRLGLDLTSKEAQPWLGVVSALYRHCRYADWLQTDPLAAESLERWLLTTLLHTQPHNYTEQLKSARLRRLPERLSHALRLTKNNLASPPTLRQLAKSVGASERQLRGWFREHLGQTHKQYMLRLRLEQVRRLLRAAVPGTQVTRILWDCGVTHHSRFTAEYRKRFGETPSQTLRENGPASSPS